jgi:hypothetical protein
MGKDTMRDSAPKGAPLKKGKDMVKRAHLRSLWRIQNQFVSAALVPWQLAEQRHRNSFIVWQLLGITDLIQAVGLGTTARLLEPQGASRLAMTVLPLSLVPTFWCRCS